MKIGIMQPYFLPYLGYWQLLNAVDTFVVYDNIQYTKKGWFNRNRILQNGKDLMLTIPIKKDSDYLNVDKRELALDFNKEKLLRRFINAYSKAPNFNLVFPEIEKIICYNSINLFDYIYNSIRIICNYLNIGTNIIISSTINIDHELKGQEKVLAICKTLGANLYLNSIGGVSLYDSNAFNENNIDLAFIDMEDIEYKQFDSPFVSYLSIIDLLMFNGQKEVKSLLNKFDLK